jgi:hypothetical protein
MPSVRAENQILLRGKRGRSADYLPSGSIAAKLRTLDYFTRGVCWEILRLMHESTEPGRLLMNGRPMLEEELGRLLGLAVDEPRPVRFHYWSRGKFVVNLESIVERLIAAGILDREESTGALICSEMIKEQKKHETQVAKDGSGAILIC